VATVELDVTTWAQTEFGDCKLGDLRRTKRLVKFAAQNAANPDASTPDQTEKWGDCQAAYRLFENDTVTFDAIAGPHWKRTCDTPPGHYLLINDTTTIDFGHQRKAKLSPVGNGGGNGFLLHSALLMDPDTQEAHGLAGQVIYYRKPVPKGETARQRLQREDRESRVWGDVIVQVGSPPPGARFTHVDDRGADNFEIFCHLIECRVDWVIRAAQLDRQIITADGNHCSLEVHLASQPILGSYELEVAAKEGRPARTATLTARAAKIRVPRPRDCSAWVRECGIRYIEMYAVELVELDPPPGVERLRWVLLTSHVAETFDEARQVIGWYECRPCIEEFHKALKTGCRLEWRQYQSAHKLEAITAVCSITAVRLLRIRSAARASPDLPARNVVPGRWVSMLEGLRKGKHRQINTIREFYRALAGLGGHLGRKCDGEPGWITLWRGFEKLQLALRGADVVRRKCV
jgi:hypothetical protein